MATVLYYATFVMWGIVAGMTADAKGMTSIARA